MGGVVDRFEEAVSNAAAMMATDSEPPRQPRQQQVQPPVPVEGSCAFVCDGTCGAVLDRPFVCGQSTCTYFMRPMRANPVTFVCSECNSRDPNGPRLCCNKLARAYIVAVDPNDGKEQLRPVWDVSQLPATVHATDCGPHVPPMNKHGIAPVIEPPSMDTVWENRHVRFTNVVISGCECSLAPNHVVVAPGQPLRLSFSFVADWRFSPNDYCPGCVVQWYVGMRSRLGEPQFRINLIRAFHSGLRGQVKNFDFIAPSFPGVYYINTNFSLDYDFIPVGFPNEPQNSIAVVQVAYLDRWNIDNHTLLPAEARRSIEAFFKLAGATKGHRHRTLDKNDCPCRLGTLEGPIYSKIFSFLGPYRD